MKKGENLFFNSLSVPEIRTEKDIKARNVNMQEVPAEVDKRNFSGLTAESLPPDDGGDFFASENLASSNENLTRVNVNTFSGALKRFFQVTKGYLYLSAPLIVLALFLVVCQYNVLTTGDTKNILYPLGDKTISWCDMQQQLVPLFCDLKDVLNGKSGFFFSMQNAGGMNFYGVFMFFLASPFSLLVAFVDKADMTVFMNVLVMLKMITAALTAAIYLRFSAKKLSQSIIVALSVFYAFSGYIMLYYQNVMWLDMVYMFPLLLLSMERLVKKGKPFMFAITLALNVLFCFYISYMIVVFVVLYFGIVILKNKSRGKKIAVDFIIGAGIALLLTAIIYVPVLIQYFRSARTSELITTLKNSHSITATYTIIPTVFCLVFIIPFIFANKMKGYTKVLGILFILTMIPIFIEPINKMWMTGNYMSFPSRYAFITIFLGLSLAGHNLQQDEVKGFNPIRAVVSFITFGLLVLFFYGTYKYAEAQLETLDAYTDTLWGDYNSFEGLLKYYAILLAVAIGLFILFKKKFFKNTVLGFLMLAVAITEGFFSMNVYMVSPSRGDESYRQTMELADAIEDDDFYRVKTWYKMTEVNNIGALGYPTLGHYTSFTSKDYLFTVKKLGYSSYWMEVGAYNGTYFTDALMSNKYTIYHYIVGNADYQFSKNSIVKNNYYMPLGVLSKNNLANTVELEGDTRRDLQESLYKNIFGGSIHTNYYEYTTENIEDKSDNEYYRFNRTSNNASIEYTITVNDRTALYFDAFDEYSNNLHEHINDSFKVSANGQVLTYSYPSQSTNGVIYLGTYQDTTVKVTIDLFKDVYLKSFGVYGVDLNTLTKTIEDSIYANMIDDGNSIKGRCYAEKGDYLFVAVPYDSGFTARINGKKTEVYKTCSGFMALKLVEGENVISLDFLPKGFVAGAVITFLGIICAALYLIFRKKIVVGKNLSLVCYICVISLFCFVVFMVYLLPVVVNFSALLFPT